MPTSDDTVREDSTASLGEGGAEHGSALLPAGGRIGPYRLIEALGRGGMGAVWRAEPAESCPVPAGSQVALKLLHRISAQERRRAAREVAYLQALHHPGVVRILDFGEHQGRPWIVMEVVEGRRLDVVLAEESPFASDRAARIAVGALEALHVAHLAGILHRDVKPGNLMLQDDGQVVVLDFGLAAAPEYESRLTASDTVIGTPAFMSPEQARGERAAMGPHSDVYALGAVLYEMVAGSPPFRADDPRALLRQVIESPLPPPSLRRAGVPRELETVILRAMAKDPADRYRSAELMAADLRRFLDGRPIRATRPGPVMPFLRACWRRRRAVALASLMLFVVLGGVALLTRALLAGPVPPSVVPVSGPEWVTELVQAEPLLPAGTPGGGRLRSEPQPSLGVGAHLTLLPPVPGPVRLAATLTPLRVAFVALLMVNDRDIGRGYAARLAGDADGARLELLREGKVMAGRALPPLAPGRTLRLALSRSEESLELRLGDGEANFEPVSFLDLVPLEGDESAGTFIAADPATVRIAEVVLERLRSGVTVSALVPADLLRQNGQFQNALKEYDKFLADHPESPLARDALLRSGLCLEALNRFSLALERFLRVAQGNRHDRRYVTLATFHAWACAVRLGRLDEAESYFIALRRDYRADQLLGHIPVDAARRLVDDHLARADALRGADPRRALDLFDTGADMAAYLGLHERQALAQTGAGDVLFGLGDSEAALEHFQAVAEGLTLPGSWRAKAQLKSAEVLRLAGQPGRAEAAYRAAAGMPETGEMAAWALLWLGDLLAEAGDEGAASAAWDLAAADQGMAGRFARAMLGREALPVEAPADPWYANDDAFVRARLAERTGDRQAMIQHLRAAATGDWPAPLAQRLLATLPPEVH